MRKTILIFFACFGLLMALPGLYYEIASTKCTGCGLCMPHCPTQAITYRHGKAIIVKEICIGCGICSGNVPEIYSGCAYRAIKKATP